jgi:hypothetical protein
LHGWHLSAALVSRAQSCEWSHLATTPAANPTRCNDGAPCLRCCRTTCLSSFNMHVVCCTTVLPDS